MLESGIYLLTAKALGRRVFDDASKASRMLGRARTPNGGGADGVERVEVGRP